MHDNETMSDSDRDLESNENLLNGKKPNNLNLARSPGEKCYTDIRIVQDECARLKKYLYGLFVVVAAGILILIVIMAVLFVKLSHDVAHHTHQPKVGETVSKILEREELCIPCDNVRLGPSVEEDRMLNEFTRKHEPEGEQCCVETPKELLAMLELFVEKRIREEVAKGNINLPRTEGQSDMEQTPAAHLMGSVSRLDKSTVPATQFQISSWIHDADLAFTTNNVMYRSGRLVVPSTGLYYVYSQVSFLELFDDGNSRDQGSPNSLSHYIYRYNIIYPHGGEEKLIQNSITKCIGQNKQFGEYTSYLGALFHLRTSDEIYVKVSNLTLIVREPKLNYFGVFKVS
ncbi:tumor necrosis factor ligand superfamily member 10-like [Ylistrum balloti]|uniref:tumor necrosis factor ligand superfamily member 10-like n=1 Tax=Ylistrum balloti TaxID=509963 RepID=UPI0029058A22|nr:tumor necrosis factor ligand superfamily member 10-like [Ylistrum balloti]